MLLKDLQQKVFSMLNHFTAVYNNNLPQQTTWCLHP